MTPNPDCAPCRCQDCRDLDMMHPGEGVQLSLIPAPMGGGMIEIALPWPPPKLNPNNARGLHWGKRAKAAKRYKQDCAWACVAAGVRPAGFRRAAVGVTFHPPNGQRRDLDNMLASIKSGLDAVSAAIGIDDSLFDLTLARGEVRPGGAVVVRITEPERKAA